MLETKGTPRPSKKPPVRTFTVYLLKEKFATAQSALQSSSAAKLKQFDLKPDTRVHLYSRRNPSAPPKWTKIFEGYADLTDLVTNGAAALLFVPCDDRLFALSFGGGRHDLIPDCWEESFGLRVTVNSIDANKIRSLDSKTFESIARHTRTQVSDESETRNFGIDIERDLLRAITGTPRDPKYGRRLSGLDALVATVKIELNQLPELLADYLERFKSEDYKQDFGWIDHVGEVRDKTIIKLADDALIQNLSNSSTEKIWLVPPVVVDWSRADKYTFGKAYQDEQVDLRISWLLTKLAGEASLDALKKSRIFLWEDEGETTHETWTCYRCIYAEVTVMNATYILTDGKWYRVNQDFVTEVRAEISKLASTDPALPKYSDKDEETYNKRVASEKGWIVADRKLVAFGGKNSKFEMCDIVAPLGDMIHVKKYAGSAPLSHLFNQGTHAAELWVGQPEFRLAVASAIPQILAASEAQPRPVEDAYRTVFAIISNSNKPLIDSLPFFSCLSLRNASRTIRRLGMRVAVVKVDSDQGKPRAPTRVVRRSRDTPPADA